MSPATNNSYQRGLPSKAGLYWLRVRATGKEYLTAVSYHRSDYGAPGFWYADAIYPTGDRRWFELNPHDFELCLVNKPE